MSDKPKHGKAGNIEFQNTEDFVARYANNVHLESSAWDLKLIFGQTDQTEGPNFVRRHTSVTLPWEQVKVFMYLMGIHLIVREAQVGKIPVPKGIIPAVAEPPTPEQLKEMPSANDAYKALVAHFESFLKDNPGTVPAAPNPGKKQMTQ